mmetsp:Transcript_20260/g.29935  ORF Transcript_20260/g.29935 Transcript_20260/m.29935 type:complete len:617 (+) Transcript_20260:89-1939(+)
MDSVDRGIIDREVRFSQCKMWDLQKSFYKKIGIKCWQECVVPNFVTSNCFISYAYARSILAFARDYFLTNPEANRSMQPIYIIEIGAGAAKLCYVMLQKLISLREFWPKRANGAPVFKYVLTDSTSTSFDFFNNHPSLKPHFESGLLDMAKFDAELDQFLTLEKSNIVLRHDFLEHPVVMVANYVFDSLRQDAFRVTKDGKIEEVLATVTAITAPIELIISREPELLKYIRCTWKAKPIKDICLYYDEDEECGAVVEEMRYMCEQRHNVGFASLKSGREVNSFDPPKNQLPGRSGEGSGSSFLLPVGTFAAMRNVKNLAKNGRMLVIAGDKGHTQLSEMDGIRDPHVAMHGSFSCMVNFLALRIFTESHGGFSIYSPLLEGFKCAAFGFGIGDSTLPLPGFRMYFSQNLGSRFGPDGFSTLQRCLKEEAKAPGLRSALAVVRLSNYDPDVLYKFKQVFIDKVPHASDKLQSDIRKDMRKVYACYYPLHPSKDVSFEIGRIFMGLKDFDVAVDFFKLSQTHCGVHHVSWYNMGVCHYYLNELDSAAQCFDESLVLCADYPDALKWRQKVDDLKEFLGEPYQNADNFHLPSHESMMNVGAGASYTPKEINKWDSQRRL